MRRARERGSISLYVAVCLVSLGMVTAALVPLAISYGVRTTRRSDELRARTAFEAGVAQLKSKSLAMTLVVPSTLSVAMNGASGTLTVAANDAQLAKSLLVAGTMVVKGQSYRYSRVIGARLPSPFLFALFSNSDLNVPKTITLGSGGWGGDAFSNAKFAMGGSATGSTINGNIMAVSTASVLGDTVVTGNKMPGQPTIVWPTLSSTSYLNTAYSQILTGNGLVVFTDATLTSVTFPAWSPGGTYALWYYGGNLNLQGTLSGRGTIFVKGNLTITSDLRYAQSTDRIAIVVQGNLNFSNGVTTIDGNYFIGGSVSDGKDLIVSRGALVANAITVGKTLTVTRDDAVMNDTNEAVRLRLPYYWP